MQPLPLRRDVQQRRHYSEITPETLHIAASHPHAEPGEPLPSRPAESPLRTLALTTQEVDDLVAFLETLTEHRSESRAPRGSSKTEALK